MRSNATEIMPETGRAILSDAGFSPRIDVRNRASVAHILGPKKQPGLYALVMSDGYFYVGESNDIKRRYAEHRAERPDIHIFVYKIVRQQKQRKIEEEHVVNMLGANGVPKTNITYSSWPVRDCDLDDVISPSAQNRFVDGSEIADQSWRASDEEQRRTKERQFKNIQNHQKYATVCELLNRYTRQGIPSPKTTEMSFWSVTAMPSRSTCHRWPIARINIAGCEVLTLGQGPRLDGLENSDELAALFHVSYSPIGNKEDESVEYLQSVASRVERAGRKYPAFGDNQLPFIVIGKENITRIMTDMVFRKAVRQANVGLMRKRPTLYPYSHCPQLADVMLE